MGLRFFLLMLCFIYHMAFAAPTLEDFTRDRDLITTAVSPNGRYLASVLDKDSIRMVVVIDLQTPGKPIVGKLGDKITRPDGVSWANDERLLVNVLVPYDMKGAKRDSEKKKDFDIDEYFMLKRMISMDIYGKNVTFLLNNQKSIFDNVNLSKIHHYLPKDNDHILMSAYKDDRNVLYKVNVYTGEGEQVIKGTRFTYLFINDYDGNTKYRLDYKPVAKQILIYELSGDDTWVLVDKIKIHEKDDEKLNLGDFVGLYNDQLVYRKINETTGYHELLLFDEKAKTTSVLVSLPSTDILGSISDLVSNKIIGYLVDGDFIRYRFFDATLQKEYDALAEHFKGQNFAITSYTDNRENVTVAASSPDNPLSFYLYNFKKNETSFVGDAYRGISSKNLSTSAMTSFSARDGRKIKSYILLPQTYEKGKTYPLIVMPHGGPQYRDRLDYDDFAQFISTRGYIVIKTNFRGSTGYGKEFETAGYKQWGQTMQEDLEDAVSFMVKKGYADSRKVCIVGGSYGGYAALMGVVKTPDLYKCAVSMNGISHLRDLIAHGEKNVDDQETIEKYWYQRIGNPAIDRAMLDKNSPLLRVSEIKTPVLLVVGNKDSIVDPSQSEKFYSAMKKEKKSVDIVRLKEAGHSVFYYEKDIEEVYKKVSAFLEENLK